jgi:ABC-type amino acid transport substrate-binding protein
MRMHIEQSTEYNDQKLELLSKVDEWLLEINQSQLKQKRINDYFKKIEVYITIKQIIEINREK